MPANATAAIGPQPMMSAKAAPGTALSSPSQSPWYFACRSPLTSSLGEYSSPSMTSRRTTPISDPIWKNSRLSWSGMRPPSPTNRPAMR